MEKPIREDFKEPGALEEYLEELKHHNRMLELEYDRQTKQIKHGNIMEKLRIDNAEKKKSDMARQERAKDLILFRKDNWQNPSTNGS